MYSVSTINGIYVYEFHFSSLVSGICAVYHTHMYMSLAVIKKNEWHCFHYMYIYLLTNDQK